MCFQIYLGGCKYTWAARRSFARRSFGILNLTQAVRTDLYAQMEMLA